jgi:serine phosphatase RsbU (regulator of sigma subunit)
MRSDVGDAFADAVERSHFEQAAGLPDLASTTAKRIGCADAALYVIDYDQAMLAPVADGGLPTLPVEGTLAGRAFTEIAAQVAPGDGGKSSANVWMPLLDGTERLGVVQFIEVDSADEEVMSNLKHAASLFAFVLVSKTTVSDLIERRRRTLPMSLPAEMQWRLLPPLTCATDTFVVSGVVLPTHDVAGDSFDYAINGSIAHLAVLDAMGHGLEATLQASVALAAYRNARRIGLSLLDTVHSLDTKLAHAFGQERFVTAIISEFDVLSGTWTWVNAGHPPALLLRGAKAVKELEGARTTPLGLQWERATSVGVERLEPGDRLLLHTDGVLEARDDHGELFGAERLADFVARALADGRPAPETLRRLNNAILEHQAGLLQDDCTTMIVEWRPRVAARRTEESATP